MKTRSLFTPYRSGGLTMVILLILFCSPTNHCRSQVAEWTFENIGTAVPGLPIAASSKIPQVRASATLAGGNNNGSPDACSGNETWSTNFWPTGSSRSTGDYLEFSVRADPGESIVINSFGFSSNASSANSATQFDVYYSKSSFNTSSFLFSGSHSTGGCTTHSGSLNTTLLPGTTIRFRIYPYGQNVAAQAATIRLDNVFVGGALLPVELTAFSAEREPGRIELYWTTASEVNNDYFAVERSRDGIDFREIGRVPGAGNSRNEQYYTFEDDTPPPGTLYYRLRQVDFDGAATIHTMIAVEPQTGAGTTEMTIWPTVVREALRLRIEAPREDGRLELINNHGLILRTVPAPAVAHTQSLPVADLPAGWYVIRYLSPQTQLQRRFLKQ